MSHHCHDEHDHDHSHGDDEHDHSDDITPALQFSLYAHINFDDVTALNEAQYGSGRAVVRKTWAERLAPEPEVASDVDEELLINIPYVTLSFIFRFFSFLFFFFSPRSFGSVLVAVVVLLLLLLLTRGSRGKERRGDGGGEKGNSG